MQFATPPRIPCTRSVSLKHSRWARLAKLCRKEEKDNARFESGPLGDTILKKGRSFAFSFHSIVYDSLPFGGLTARTSATVLSPLKAPSATPCTITQKTKFIPRTGCSLNQFRGLLYLVSIIFQGALFLVSQCCIVTIPPSFQEFRINRHPAFQATVFRAPFEIKFNMLSVFCQLPRTFMIEKI